MLEILEVLRKESYGHYTICEQMEKELTHGIVNSYNNHGCRCDECRQANTDYTRERRRYRKENPERFCEMPNCDKVYYASGYCGTHYQRVQNTGTPYREFKGRAFGGKKYCARCDDIKSVDAFYSNKSREDGLSAWCKECKKQYNREYYQENTEKFKEYWRRNYARNGEKHRARGRKYYWDNKIKAQTNQTNLIAGKNGAEGTITEEELFKLFNKYQFSCLQCGGPPGVDHVVPLSHGGSNTIDNIQPLCTVCNSEKGTRTKDYRV